MKKLIISFALLIVAVVVALSWSQNEVPTPDRSTSTVTQPSSQPSQEQIHMHEFAAKGRVPAHYTSVADLGKLPPTLSPELFAGNVKLAYQAAKEIPQTLAQLPCYCHCDRGHGHKSLHSCFESEHGVNCGICIGEALMAHNLQKQGVAASEIRKRIISAYGQSR